MREVPVPVPVLSVYRPLWIFTHLALILSIALNIILLIQLERAKNVQDELIKDHEQTIKKLKLTRPQNKEAFP